MTVSYIIVTDTHWRDLMTSKLDSMVLNFYSDEDKNQIKELLSRNLLELTKEELKPILSKAFYKPNYAPGVPKDRVETNAKKEADKQIKDFINYISDNMRIYFTGEFSNVGEIEVQLHNDNVFDYNSPLNIKVLKIENIGNS